MVSSPMDSRSGMVAEESSTLCKGIRKKAKNSESIAFKRYKIDNYNLLELDKVLNDAYCSFRPVSADYYTRKKLVNNLNAMALEIYGNSKDSSPILEAYGSFVMDMFSTQSDLDVSINFGNRTSELSRDKKLEILKRFADKLRSLQGQGHVRNVVTIFTARVPIVKFVDQGTSIECDLSVENNDGILNSQIIQTISQIDDRFQKLCLLIKRWAKAHDVNSAQHQTLNSVSITLLVAHHLQTQNPPILPPFCLLFKDGIDPANVEKRMQRFLKWGQRNKESLGRLFVTFFVKLQSVEFLWRKGLCASLLTGLWISKKGKKAGGGCISIEDFVDVSQNVARRVNGKGATKIYGCINRTVEDVFEFLNGKVVELHLKNRLFSEQVVVESPLYHVPLLPDIRQNKRVSSGNRMEEENVRGKRMRYARTCNGFVQFCEIPGFGIRNRPLDDHCVHVPLNGGGNNHMVQHRHDRRFNGEVPMPVSLWQDYSHRIDLPLPPPPPPYDGLLYERFGPQNFPDPYFGGPPF